MKIKRKIIEIDEEKCNGCGICVPSCAEGALQIINGKARLVSEKFCDGLGACLGECPTGALRVVEREAEEFDEIAVEQHLAPNSYDVHATLAWGCPSTRVQTFAGPGTPEFHEASKESSVEISSLTHWPVQIRLVPPNAPFLKGAHLLVAADCTPVAYPNFHRDFLNHRVIMVGCPKFDDVKLYTQRFAEVFEAAGIKSIKVVVMEVPCCQNLPVIVKKGLELSKKSIPLEQVTISTRGDVVRSKKFAT